MKALQIVSLLICLALVFPAMNSYVNNEEQRFIDYLRSRGSKEARARHEEKSDEPEKTLIETEEGSHIDEIEDDQRTRLIKKSATAIIQRMLMPSPPSLDVMLEKAVHFVMKKTIGDEYTQIKSGIKELVVKMIHKNPHNEERDLQNPRLKSSETSTSLREEKIVIAMEEILKELAIRLNLTTSQIKKIVVISVKVLAEHLGLNPFQRERLHERVTSQVRKMLDIEDEDNKDARLRRLEERIEKDIEKFQFSAKQVKRVEELMVEEEAVEESLTKEEKQRMLKRVYADVIDDLRAQKNEQNIRPPNLSHSGLIAVTGLIQQKALELHLRKEELKVLGLSILTAVENLSRNVKPTQEAKTKTGLTLPRKTRAIPTTWKTAEQITMTTKHIANRNTMTTVVTESVDSLMNENEERENDEPAGRTTLHIAATVAATHAPKTQAETRQRTLTTHARETEPKTGHRTLTDHAHETEPITSQRTPNDYAHETEPKASQRTPTEHAHETQAKTSQRTPTTQAPETEPNTSQWISTAHAQEEEPAHGPRSLVEEDTDLDAELAQDEAELEGKDFVTTGNFNMDQEKTTEELELLLEQKAQEKEEFNSLTTESTPNVSMPTKDQVTHSSSRSTKVTDTKTRSTKIPEGSVTKPTEPRRVTSRVTHGVTQATEKVTQREKPTTKHVTLRVATVTQPKQSDLRHKKREEDISEGRVPEPSKSHVTQSKHQVKDVTQAKTHATEVTQTKFEHVTASKANEHFAKELKSILEEKRLHSRKNHELLQDEDKMDELGLRKIEKPEETSLEDELALIENHYKQKGKKKTLEEELTEVLKTKKRETNQLEDELESLKR